MAGNSSIEWTDATWNPIAGCTPVSPGCKHCYAATMARRLEAMGQEKYVGTAERRGDVDVFTGKITFDEKALRAPLRWRKPRRVFVNSMSDLFHEDVPYEFIDRVFAVMALCEDHTFQVLTKRPDRAARYFDVHFTRHKMAAQAAEFSGCRDERYGCDLAICNSEFPLPNVWFGTSVEDQQRADERIPQLIKIPAAVRFLSCEPLLGPVDLTPPDLRGGNVNVDSWLQELSWIIVGGESGHHARPMHPKWARDIRDRCLNRTDMGRPWPLPFFFKQWGEYVPSEGSGGWTWQTKCCFTLYDDGKKYDPKEVLDRSFHPESMARVNKKRAGRLLDGVEHNDFPSPVKEGSDRE